MGLQYYDVENETYPHECEYELCRNSTLLLSRSILYTEDIPNIKISFSLNAKVGNANYSKRTLKYNKHIKTSVLTVCHETGHLIDRKENGYEGKRAHTKRHKKIVKRLIKLCRKNNYFGLINMGYVV